MPRPVSNGVSEGGDGGRRRAHRLGEHLEAERGALDLARMDPRRGIAGDEAPAEVGAAGDRAQADVGLDVAVDVVVAVRHQGRPGAADGLMRTRLKKQYFKLESNFLKA